MTQPQHLSHALEYIDNWLAFQKAINLSTPGYSVAICFEGKTVFKKAYGYADLKTKEPLTPDHLFRVASHAKTFTAVAIFQLQEQGKLKLDDKASEYLGFLNQNKDSRIHEITIRQLLSHGAGVMRDGPDAGFWQIERSFPSRDEVKSFFIEQPLSINANTQMKYSNYGFALLGLLIEKITGQSYGDYIQQNIFDGLKLENIGPDHDPDGLYAKGYSGVLPTGKQIELPHDQVTDGMVAATGIYANAEALCIFYSQLIEGNESLILSTSSKREFKKLQWVPNSFDNKYAYAHGCGVKEMDGLTLYGHRGGMPGFFTRTYVSDDKKISISFLSNALTQDAENLQAGLWHILNFFEQNNTQDISYPNIKGIFQNIWFSSYFVPLGDYVYESFPAAFKPFEICSTLEYEEDGKFKVIKEADPNYIGEYVLFNMDANEITSVLNGGYLQRPLKAFDEFTQKFPMVGE